MFMPADVDSDRLQGQLATLSRLGMTTEGGITRPTFSPAHLDATFQAAAWMAEAGLEVTFDRWGNLYGRTPGMDNTDAVMSGSHLDSVPNGGNYDGVLGVLAALEAVRMIRASGRALKRPLQVVSFIEEEGTRFQGLSGSQLATGSISEEEAAALTDAEGNRLLDLLATIDFPHPVDRHLRLDRGAAAFVEVHIEQGKRLERQGKQIGVVTGVAGPTFAQLTLTGRADHAGATDYADRHDTLLAAADVIHSVYDLGTGRFAGKARLTVGAIKAQPNATNVIAGKTTLKIDYRAGDDDTYATIPSVLEQRVVEIAAKRQVQHELRTLHRVAPIHFAADVIDAVTAAAAAAGLTQVPLVSWAAHDAMVMAEVCAAGMIFVPCRDGRSHTPEEYVSPEHIAAGVATLANTLLELST